MSSHFRSRQPTPAAHPVRTPSITSVVSTSSVARDDPSRSSSSLSQPVRAAARPSPPIFSSPMHAAHSRRDVNRLLRRSPRPSTSTSSARSEPSLPSYPQARPDRLSLPPRSSGTPAVSVSDHRSGSYSARGSNDYPEGDEPEGLDEIIMAIDMRDNGTVGSAYYVAIDEALFLQEDVTMAGIEFVETLLLRVEPTTVLISLRSPDSLVEFLEAGAQDFEGNREGIEFLSSHQRQANVHSRSISWCLRPTNFGIFRVQLRAC